MVKLDISNYENNHRDITKNSSMEPIEDGMIDVDESIQTIYLGEYD